MAYIDGMKKKEKKTLKNPQRVSWRLPKKKDLFSSKKIVAKASEGILDYRESIMSEN